MKKQRGIRFGLLAFLLAICSAGAIVGMTVRFVTSRPVYVSLYSRLGAYPSEGKWRVVGGREELLYIFIVPKAATYSARSCNFTGSPPDATGITCVPEGLFVDGERVETSPRRKVFVFTQQRKMRPIDLSPDELARLTTTRMDNLENSALWRGKIAPIVSEEKWINE